MRAGNVQAQKHTLAIGPAFCRQRQGKAGVIKDGAVVSQG